MDVGKIVAAADAPERKFQVCIFVAPPGFAQDMGQQRSFIIVALSEPTQRIENAFQTKAQRQFVGAFIPSAMLNQLALVDDSGKNRHRCSFQHIGQCLDEGVLFCAIAKD